MGWTYETSVRSSSALLHVLGTAVIRRGHCSDLEQGRGRFGDAGCRIRARTGDIRECWEIRFAPPRTYRHGSDPIREVRHVGPPGVGQSRKRKLTRDRIFAGFHTDLNFLTIHGQSRYPGREP
jgi:hypothetical protein